MQTSIKEKADQLFEDGELETLYELIEPFLKANDPYAQLLYSSFSLERLNESDADFEARSLALLKSASEGGLGDASYRLGVLYLYGDAPATGGENSSVYFERAIKQGHSHSKFTYGFNLYYGTETKQDKPRGLQLRKIYRCSEFHYCDWLDYQRRKDSGKSSVRFCEQSQLR